MDAQHFHTSVPVADIGASIAFYTDVLGYELVFRRPGTDALAAMLDAPGVTGEVAHLRHPSDDSLLELIVFEGVPDDRRETLPVLPGHAHTAFKVPSLDAAVAEARAHGATPLAGPARFPLSTTVLVREPGGSVVELVEPHAG